MFKWTQQRMRVLLFMGLVVHGTIREKLIGASTLQTSLDLKVWDLQMNKIFEEPV